MYSPDQLRAARALLGWSRQELSEASGVSAIAIKLFESGQSDPRQSTLIAIRLAFSRNNVEFVDANADHGLGVAFRLSA